MIEAQENFEKKNDSGIEQNSDDLEETTVFPSTKSLHRINAIQCLHYQS